MHFAIVNQSKDPALSNAVLEQIAVAIESQLYDHYAPFWEAQGAKVSFFPLTTKSVPSNVSLVVIFDDASQAGLLGYHDVTPDGHAYGRAFWLPTKNSGGSIFGGPNSLSVTLSHEILEMIQDQYANFWAQNPNTGLLHALELCDAVESSAYPIDGIYVSNFVGPRFFRLGPGPYDWMSHFVGGDALVVKPFETCKDGYQIVMQAGQVRNIYGRQYPEWKKEMKEYEAARSMKRTAVALGLRAPDKEEENV